jgi:hypothetical protein
MTTRYGTNATKLAALTPSNMLNAEQSGGVVRSMVERYTGTTVNSGDLLYLGKMPKGAIPLGGFLRYTGSDTGVLSIGYAGDTDALGTATALATTATQYLVPTTAQMNTPLTADRDIYATFGSGPAHVLASTDKIEINYLYAKD